MANVLVVDDEPEIQTLIARIMESRGHTVTLARDGKGALEAAARAKPDLVILDLNLPELDGFEVCKRLKADPATSAIPVIMLTAAHVELEDARRGVAIGADEYIVKPFLRDVLVHNVERLIGKKG